MQAGTTLQPNGGHLAGLLATASLIQQTGRDAMTEATDSPTIFGPRALLMENGEARIPSRWPNLAALVREHRAIHEYIVAAVDHGSDAKNPKVFAELEGEEIDLEGWILLWEPRSPEEAREWVTVVARLFERSIEDEGDLHSHSVQRALLVAVRILNAS